VVQNCTTARLDRTGAAGAEARSAGAAAGLVPTKQSTRGPGFSEGKTGGAAAPAAAPGTVWVSHITATIEAMRLARCQRRVNTTARLAVETVETPLRWSARMITLTYAPGRDWCSDHVRDFLKRIKAWAARNGVDHFPYTWVAELQERGAVHYHVLLWLPRRLLVPKADKRGWWPHGSTRTEAVKQTAVGYVAKYASKLQTKAGQKFPRGLRLHGAGGIRGTALRVVRWWMAPRWARDLAPDPELDLRRVVGGYCARATGEFFRSPWRLVERCPRWTWVRFENMARSPFAAGEAVTAL
jgi:hypothetical protein